MSSQSKRRRACSFPARIFASVVLPTRKGPSTTMKRGDFGTGFNPPWEDGSDEFDVSAGHPTGALECNGIVFESSEGISVGWLRILKPIRAKVASALYLSHRNATLGFPSLDDPTSRWCGIPRRNKTQTKARKNLTPRRKGLRGVVYYASEGRLLCVAKAAHLEI